jgi:hypothetical protein
MELFQQPQNLTEVACFRLPNVQTWGTPRDSIYKDFIRSTANLNVLIGGLLRRYGFMAVQNNTVHDFVMLFNVLWYRDFPLSENYKVLGTRAEWTIHIGVVVRSCADLLGLFTYFESGVRTDAIIRDNQGNDVAHMEWEWFQPLRIEVNEIKKLYEQRKNAEFSAFFSYSRRDHHAENLNSIKKQWKKSIHPLLVFLVTFGIKNQRRWFYDLETYLVHNGSIKKIRSQPALPWDAEGTRWQSIKEQGVE